MDQHNEDDFLKSSDIQTASSVVDAQQRQDDLWIEEESNPPATLSVGQLDIGPATAYVSLPNARNSI